MPSFIVTYDLVKEESSADYKPLIDDLKARGGQKYQLSSWLVNVDATAAAVYDHYNKMIDNNDKLMVLELTRNHKQGGNFQGTSDWILRNPPIR